jgi:hypothetical protein
VRAGGVILHRDKGRRFRQGRADFRFQHRLTVFVMPNRLRRRHARSAKQGILLRLFQHLLCQLAMAIFLPGVVNHHTKHGDNSQPGQADLQFSHVLSFWREAV